MKSFFTNPGFSKTFKTSLSNLEVPKIARAELIANVQQTFGNHIEINAANATWKGLENLTHYVFLPYVIYKGLSWLYGHSKKPKDPAHKPGYTAKLTQLIIAEGLSDLLRSYWGKTALWDMYKTEATAFIGPIARWCLGIDVETPLIDPTTGTSSDLLFITSGEASNAAYQWGTQLVEYMDDPAKLQAGLMGLIPDANTVAESIKNTTTTWRQSLVAGGYGLLASAGNAGYGLLASARNAGYGLLASAGNAGYGLLASAGNATFVPVVNAVDGGLWNAAHYGENRFVSADTIHNGIYTIAAAAAALYAIRVGAAWVDHLCMPPNNKPVVNQYITQQAAATKPKTAVKAPTYWDYVPGVGLAKKMFA